jgi:NhaA family Na+:H+ antiporter
MSALERFLHIEAVSGAVLLAAAAAALIWANSPLGAAYQSLWHAPVAFGVGSYVVSQPLHFWINDGLMTIFFLVAGTEIRREIHDGALASVRAAALPLAAALGGVIVPALIYAALNDAPLTRRGWAVPTATDIAFAVGVLALLGTRIAANVRVLLLALAIVDDIVAVLVIAAFYSEGLDVQGLLIAGAAVLMVLSLQWIGIGSAWVYVFPGAVLWFGLLKAGIHPSLSGVVLGLLTPATLRRSSGTPLARDLVPPAERVQNSLHIWVAYGVMPLFALANAGVAVQGVNFAGEGSLQVLLGVAVALVVGKPIGVFTASWLAVRMGWCSLPPGLAWRDVALVGLLAGIGFTMSIFIATLAFTSDDLLNAAKLGVLLASFVAAVVGLCAGWWLSRARTAA